MCTIVSICDCIKTKGIRASSLYTTTKSKYHLLMTDTLLLDPTLFRSACFNFQSGKQGLWRSLFHYSLFPPRPRPTLSFLCTKGGVWLVRTGDKTFFLQADICFLSRTSLKFKHFAGYFHLLPPCSSSYLELFSPTKRSKSSTCFFPCRARHSDSRFSFSTFSSPPLNPPTNLSH